jgi:uncharacterized protein (TIGR02145 family)
MKNEIWFCQLVLIGTIFLSSGCAVKKMSSGTVKDIDGNRYVTVKIGEQEWMKEDLKTTRFNDGTTIPNVTDITEWRHIDSPAYVWYDNDISNKDTYGAMYNWWAVGSRQDLCPAGWRVATDEDWKILEKYVGMTTEQIQGTAMRGTNEGGKLKEAGNRTWASPNDGATDEYRFTVLPGGRRPDSGVFGNITRTATIWTSTETSFSTGVYRHFSAGSPRIGRNIAAEKKYGFAVRCLKKK